MTGAAAALVAAPAAGTPAAPPGPPAAAPADMDAALAAALALYDADRLLDASRALAALAAAAPPAFEAALARDARVAALRADAAEVDRVYAALGSAGSEWVTCYAGAATTVEYRPEPDRVSHTMRASGVIRAPLRNVAALLNEPDLFPAVFWFVMRSEVVGRRGRFRRGADLTLYAPPPLCNRDICMYGFAVDALDNDDCILVVSRDRCEADDVGAVPPPDGRDATSRRAVRASVHYSMFELRPVSPNVTNVRLIGNADPALAYVPMLLINWGSRVIMRFALRVLEARARDIDALPHAERLGDPVYGWIDSRLVAYWGVRGFSEDEVRAGEAADDDGDDASSGGFDPDTAPAPPSRSSLIRLLTPSVTPTASIRSGLNSLRRMVSRD